MFDRAGIESLAAYVLSLSLAPHDADSIVKASDGKKLFAAIRGEGK